MPSPPIRDRVRELRRVPARELKPHPRNWRTHPAGQRSALAGLLAQVGYAAALVARELADGTLQLIDGHLRAETTPEAIVPVLVVDVDEAEADALLASLDPLAALAERDEQRLAGLLADLDTESEALRTFWDGLAAQRPSLTEPERAARDELYQVVVTCRDEAEQRTVYERLRADGCDCRLVVL